MAILSLLTDFGLQDPFVGVMKGVILGIAPDAALVDLTHAIARHDVAAGARALAHAVPSFPPGSVHLAVVDPGVGSTRAALAIQAQGPQWLVGPDNGLLGWAADALGGAQMVVQLDRPQFHLPKPSPTFHGRDIFAPVAAHLARGVPLAAVGTPVAQWIHLPVSQPLTTSDGLRAHVVHVDVFGNLLTDLSATRLQTWLAGRSPHAVTWAVGPCHWRRLAQTFSDVEEGAPVAYVGSDGWVELAVRNGNAANVLGAAAGAHVEVGWASER